LGYLGLDGNITSRLILNKIRCEDPVADCCENGNEPLVFIRNGECFDILTKYKFLKTVPAQ
jgi:hypothetical protein